MSGLWVPSRKLDTITLYVDETYLHRHTGVLKAAISVPEGARAAFQAAVIPVLANRQGNEFKARGIKRGTLAAYREFLRCIATVIAESGEQAPLRSIVSIESMRVYRSKGCESLRKVYEQQFSDRGVQPRFARDMAELTIWCVGHLQHILPHGAANRLAIVVDEKHRSDRIVGARTWIHSRLLGFATPMILRDILPGMLNVALRCLRGRPKVMLPAVDIAGVDCVRSPDSIYLQAADLLSNLTYNYLLYRKGVRATATTMKYELLSEFIGGGEPSEALLGWLQVEDGGSAGFRLVGGSGALVGRVTLGGPFDE